MKSLLYCGCVQISGCIIMKCYSALQFSNVGSDPVGKLEFDFVDAPNVRAIRDNSLNFRLEAGESKEHIFAFNVSRRSSYFSQF